MCSDVRDHAWVCLTVRVSGCAQADDESVNETVDEEGEEEEQWAPAVSAADTALEPESTGTDDVGAGGAADGVEATPAGVDNTDAFRTVATAGGEGGASLGGFGDAGAEGGGDSAFASAMSTSSPLDGAFSPQASPSALDSEP